MEGSQGAFLRPEQAGSGIPHHGGRALELWLGRAALFLFISFDVGVGCTIHTVLYIQYICVGVSEWESDKDLSMHGRRIPGVAIIEALLSRVIGISWLPGSVFGR